MASNCPDDSNSECGENNIQVFIRIRPPCAEDPAYSRVVETDFSNKKVLLKQEPNPRVFAFDFVADVDSAQEEIFSRLGKKVIENCIAGYNGTIFAYGQTGSGKTFTMLGPSEDSDNFQHELRGVIPRSFEYLYTLINREKELHAENKQFLCKCSFLEIYNEQIFDLLEPSNVSLHLRESLKTGVYVSGLSEQVVADASEAYEVLNSSWMNRTVASTSMNRESSRSHAVFTLQIESKEKKGSVEHIRTSQLHLVDLAGSERQKDTKASGQRLKEAGSINKSLSNLGNVIMALVSVSRDGKARYIPYRDSKLTFLLRDSLGGNSKTSLIACVHPGHKCFGETLSTLMFAKRAKMIKTQAVLNENSMGNVQQLQAEIKILKEELAAFRSGNITKQPAVSGQPVESMPVLREMFLQAMCLRQKSEMEKMELHEAVQNLKDICQKKDKAIQTNRMIVKFRDDNIKRLEGKLKGVNPDEPQEVGLKKEIEALQTLVDHHPAVTQYMGEVRKLKSSIRTLKEDSGILGKIHADGEKVKHLEEEYNKLIAEQKGDSGEATPQRADTVATSTVNNLRAKVSDLETNIEKLNQELSETKQNAEKKEMYLKGEVETYKKTVEELEMVISANTTKTKLEKAALNEMHLQTVMTITTPKKESYRLRNRTVVTKTNTPDLDTSIPYETELSPVATMEEMLAEEGIMGEDEPEDMAQQAQEALCEQIKKLQDTNASLETRLSEYETDRVKQVHQQSVLESQLKSVEELFEKEKHQFNQQKEQFGKITEEKNMAIGEVIDLKAMIAQVDNELKESKQKLKNLEKEKSGAADVLQSKIAEFDVALQHIEKQNAKLQEENEILTINLETEYETNMFNQSLVLQLDDKITKQELTIKEMEQHLMNAEKTILDEKELRESLVEQMDCEGAEKTKETLKQIEEKETLMQEYATLKNLLEAHEDSAATLRKVIEERDSRIQQLEKAIKVTEDKLSQYYIRLQESENEAAELKQYYESAEEQITMYKGREENLTSKVEELQKLMDEKDSAFSTKYSGMEMEVCVLKDELSFYEKTIQEQKEAYEALQEKQQAAESDQEAMTNEITQLKALLKEEQTMKSEHKDLELAELTQTLTSLEASRLERTNENIQLKAKISDIQNEYDTLRTGAETLKSQYQAVYDALAEKTREIVELTAEYGCEKEIAKKAETENKDLVQRNLVLKTCLEEKETENIDLEATVERLHGVAARDNEENQRLRSQLVSVETKLHDLCRLYEVPGSDETLENLVKRVKSTKEEYDKLLVENCDLVGHNNSKQKIRYHTAVKNENSQLKKDLVNSEDKCRHLNLENRDLKKRLKESQQKSIATKALKENVAPPHKTFISGDYTMKSTNFDQNS